MDEPAAGREKGRERTHLQEQLLLTTIINCRDGSHHNMVSSYVRLASVSRPISKRFLWVLTEFYLDVELVELQVVNRDSVNTITIEKNPTAALLDHVLVAVALFIFLILGSKSSNH